MFPAAEVGDDLGKFTRLVVRRALEHQMLEEMRDPGLSTGSSAEPFRYQTICVTTGGEMVGNTTTSKPFGQSVMGDGGTVGPVVRFAGASMR